MNRKSCTVGKNYSIAKMVLPTGGGVARALAVRHWSDLPLEVKVARDSTLVSPVRRGFWLV